MKKAVILLTFVTIAAGCAGKKSGETQKPIPEIDCLCVMPAEILSSEPELSPQDEKSISELVRDEVADAVIKDLPAEVRLKRIEENGYTDECDAFLTTQIQYLQLVEKKDTAASAAATTAGIALMAVTGIGFVSVPSARMGVEIKLSDPEGEDLWNMKSHPSTPSVSLKEDYPGQVKALIGQVKPKIGKGFPIKKGE